jgi:transcriptional regulator with XRE-family HTH domain
MTGPEQLEAHLKRRKLTFRALAAELGVSASLVFMWTSGERKPGLANALVLEKVTGIPARAWVAKRLVHVRKHGGQHPPTRRVGPETSRH